MPSRALTYARLLRLPNVFTAFGDVLMATAAAGLWDHAAWGTVALLCAASGCLYCGGMVLNDYCDRHDDAKTRPFRPIPSGAVSTTVANAIWMTLFMAGWLFAYIAGYPQADQRTPTEVMPYALVGAICLYNYWLKHTPFGPLSMGLCRFLNVLLGFSVVGFPPVAWHLASVVGLYIVGVTLFARTEEGVSSPRVLRFAALVMAAALLLALFVPMHLEPGASPWVFPYLLVLFGFGVGTKVLEAVRRPRPKEVQAAVKRSILGLLVLDAVLASAFVGLPGLLILGLLLPALLFGRRIYST